MNKNDILLKFSGTFFIEKEEMLNYFRENGYVNFEDIYQELEEMRRNAFDLLWKKTEPDLQLTEKEIVNISKDYLLKNYPWIEKTGIKSVNNYLLWMCWHEGILK